MSIFKCLNCKEDYSNWEEDNVKLGCVTCGLCSDCLR